MLNVDSVYYKKTFVEIYISEDAFLFEKYELS